MKPRELTIAEKAKSALIHHGWRQGFPRFGDGGGLCLAEALAVACEAPGLDTSDGIVDAAHDAARRLGFADAYDVVAWNDTPRRTLSEVLERLDTWA